MTAAGTGSSKTARVYEALKEELLDGQFAPDTKLAIDQIAARFGVNVGAVREALSRLTSDRLVVALPQRGFVTAHASAEDLRDLTDVRIEIETRCLRRSIALGGLEWEGRLLATWHQLSHTANVVDGRANADWTRLHARFHDDLIAACDGVWWLRLRESLYTQAERYRRMIPPGRRVGRDINAEHRWIMELTLARDTEAACAALAEHMEITTRMLLGMGLPHLGGAEPGRETERMGGDSRC